MRISGFGRYVLSSRTAAAMLAGCGGSPPPIGAMGANLQTHALARQLSSSGQPLLYAFGSYGSGNGKILDYPSGNMVSEFVPKPSAFAGTCSDSEGNVYLGGSDETSSDPAISEYGYGTTTPSEYAVVTSQSYGVVRGCSTDPTTGDIAALIQSDGPESAVAVFAPQLQGIPQIYADSSMDRLWSASYDGSGNLFLLGFAGPHDDELRFAELFKGGTSFEAISLSLGSHLPKRQAWDIRWAVQWDGQYITIDGAYSPKPSGKPKTWKQAIYRLKISGSAATVAQTIFLKQPEFEFFAMYSITPTLNSIVETDHAIREFDYPAGKRIDELKLGGPSYVSTIAIPPSP